MVCDGALRKAVAAVVHVAARTATALLAATVVVAAAAVPAGAGTTPAAPAWTDLGDIAFTHVALNDDALPDGAALAGVTQDGSGFLWLGSQAGLARWDGYRFHVYTPSPEHPDRAPKDVLTIFADARGRVWTGGHGGVSRYDDTIDAFAVYRLSGTLKDDTVRCLADDGAGGVWFGTAHGLGHIDGTTGQMSVGWPAGTQRMPADRVSGLLHTQDGALWLGTKHHGAYRRDPRTGRFTHIELPSPDGFPVWPWVFTQDHAGRMWIGTVHHGAYVLEPGTSVAHPLVESEPGNPLQSQWVQAVVEARRGELWLATTDGIVAVDAATRHTRRIRRDPSRPESLPQNDISGLFRDRSGLVWVTTDRSLSDYDARQDAIVNLAAGSARKNGLSASGVTSIFADGGTRIWLGTSSTGIDLIDPVRGRIANIPAQGDGNPTTLPAESINSIRRVPASDTVYLATARGLFRTDRAARHVARVDVPGRENDAWTAALLAARGELWIGGSDGVHTLPLTGAGPPRAVTGVDGPGDLQVSVFEPTGPRLVWVGTHTGLRRLDLDARRVTHVPGGENLEGQYITALLVDARGRLWVGTDRSGIWVLRVDASGGLHALRELTLADGLANVDVGAFAVAADGRIWASCDGGIAVIDPQTFALRALRAADGDVFIAYWTSAAARLPDGNLLFAGSDGLSVVRPNKLRAWTFDPPVAITELRVGAALVSTHPFTGSPADPPLTIAPDANSFAVEFAALDFSAPQRNRYAYKLDGYDTQWTQTDASDRRAAYANLPPGRYRLLLRGTNRNGTWSTHRFALTVDVLGAWYQTWWFHLVQIVAALGGVLALVHLRTAYFARRARALEQLVDERTSALRESQQRLETLAYIDNLTTLPNRRMFGDEFNKLVTRAARQNENCTLLLIDLDRFKAINDTYGHDAGDAVLVEASQRLRSVVRASDCVARLGGDEFAILLGPDHDEASTELVCRRLVERFELPVEFGDARLSTSPSIGIAVYPRDGLTQDVLYKSADLALYDAKGAGRNTWRRYRGGLRAH